MLETIYSWLYVIPRLFEWIVRKLALRFLPQAIQQIKTRAPISLADYGSLEIFKQLPTEILTEIFVHTCGDEYISIFNRLSPPSDEALLFSVWEINTVYVLKAVCKDWEELAERTPRLWRSISIDFDNLYARTGRLPSAQYFQDLAKQVLSRSAELCLHLRLHGHERHPELRSGTLIGSQYFVPLFLILVKEGHRWFSVHLSDLEPMEGEEPPASHGEIYRSLENVIAAASLPQLRRLTYQSANNTPQSIAPKLDFTSSAPQLKHLTLRLELSRRLGSVPELLQCHWGSLTSLVIDPEGTPTNDSSSWGSIIRPLIPVLQAVRQSLERLHLRGSSVYDIEPSEDHPRSFKTIELTKLREFVLEDTQAMRLSHTLLPRLLCPVLQTFELLLCKPLDENKSWVPSVPHRLYTLQEFLASVPLLQSFALLQIPNLPYNEVRRDNPRRENEHIRHGYLAVCGTPTELDEMVQNTALGVNEGPSPLFGRTSIPLITSARTASNAKREGLAKVMSFVPWTTYTPIPFINRVIERPRLLPPRVMTAWEERHQHDRHEEEVELVEKLSLFSQSLWGTYGEYSNGDHRAMMGALNAMDASSVMVMMHLLLMMSGSDAIYPCAMPCECNITLSVVV